MINKKTKTLRTRLKHLETRIAAKKTAVEPYSYDARERDALIYVLEIVETLAVDPRPGHWHQPGPLPAELSPEDGA